MQGNRFKHTSLDSFFNDDEDGCRYDVVADENSKNLEDDVCQSLDFELIMDCRHILNDREYEVIVRSLGLFNNEQETLESIGNSFNVTREAVRQTKERALKKLRKHFSYMRAA